MKILGINFIDDGWIGWDKLGHFTRHVIFVSTGIFASYLVCWLFSLPTIAMYCCVGAIAFYDTLWDFLYEYMNSVAGIGFSLKDILYGRAGMVITLLVLRWML